uniref:NADH dehydrogenase subunit 4L n=1 Tax=Aglaiogyrodactylus forficulatus TaxID=1853073 RepID=A0A173G4Q6_9PLAT|nr:NADH dehydrogenase subunit 4L [Aglaiogyrodactylus forficulatus]ANH20403.1 NADH dehydrogenase subunit 4L [Aglaiogyrodactylus forficulatus]
MLSLNLINIFFIISVINIIISGLNLISLIVAMEAISIIILVCSSFFFISGSNIFYLTFLAIFTIESLLILAIITRLWNSSFYTI